MKPIIGIIARPVLSDEKNKMLGVYEEISNAIYQSGGIPVGILSTTDIDEFLPQCDGLIFQGGDESEEYEKRYLTYAYEHDIPTLGICLGMQLMANIFEGNLIEIVGHKEKDKQYVHEVIIKKNSKLYSIIKKEKIEVNSRHKSAVKNTKIQTSAIAIDGVIEAIEDKKKLFFVGIQWHPESMIAYDKVAQNLFKGFVDACRK